MASGLAGKNALNSRKEDLTKDIKQKIVHRYVPNYLQEKKAPRKQPQKIRNYITISIFE